MTSLMKQVCEWMLRTSLVKSRRMAEPSLPSSLSSDDVGTAKLVPRIVQGVETSRLGDDFVVVDNEGRMLRGLSPTGARVFELMDGARSTGEIASVLAGEFGLSLERAYADVRRFLLALSEGQLIVYDAPGPNPSPSP
jgi:pyrroloquinoline quinone biosynthesis protein D